MTHRRRLATVAFVVAAVAVSGAVGIVAAADATSATAEFEGQVIASDDTILVENVQATDADGNPAGGTLVVYRTITNSDGVIQEAYVAGIERRNSGTFDGGDVTVDVSALVSDGNENVGSDQTVEVALLPESVATSTFSDVSAGDRLDAGPGLETEPSPEFNALLQDNVLTQPDNDFTPQAILYEASADADDVTVTTGNLDSVTVQPASGSDLATYADGGSFVSDRDDYGPNEFRVSVSTSPLQVGDDDTDPAVIDTTGTFTDTTNGGVTFDLSGEGLSGTETLYVNVHDSRQTNDEFTTVARDGNVAESSSGDVADSFTLTVQEPDVQVTSVTPQDSNVVEGDTLDVDATLDNQGNVDASGQTVTLEVDANQDGSFTQVDSQNVDLASGSTTDVTLSYETQSGDGNNVDVRVTTEDDTEGVTETASVLAPSAVTGASATGPVNPQGTAKITATVEASNGDPVKGVDVTFSHDGAGTLTTTQGTSNVTGTVVAEYTGDITDAGKTVTVTIDGENQDLDPATASVAVNDIVVTVEPDGTTPVDPAVEGTRNSIDLRATLTAEDGTALDGETLSFSTPRANGELDTTSATTDSNGEATVTYTVGANDWDLDSVRVASSADGTDSSDTAAFQVNEPRVVVTGLTADTDPVAPTGTTDVTATATYEAPFDSQTQSDETVGFRVVPTESGVGAGTLDGQEPPITLTTGSDGQATATYGPASDDYGSNVRVGAGISDGGETTLQDTTSFTVQEPVTVDATADLGVTAPPGTDITFELQGEGTTLTKTATTSAGDGTASVTFGSEATLDPGEYTVTVTDGDGVYRTGDSVTVSPASGETTTAQLSAPGRDATLDVDATFDTTIPENEYPVTIEVAEPGGFRSETVFLSAGDGDLSTTDTELTVPAIDNSSEYEVRVTAENYAETPDATAYVEPGGSDTIDAGTVAADDVTVGATAELNVTAPPDGTDVTFTLRGPDGTEQATQTTTVEAGTSAASVGFGAQPALDAADSYTVTVDAAGYQTAEPTATTAGQPGASETAALGTLDSEDTTLTVDATLGTTAPTDDYPVDVTITTPDGTERTETVQLARGETGVSVTESLPAIDSAESYDVTVDADGYTATSTTAYVAPGERGTATVGTVAAEDATIGATADLEEPAPSGGKSVAFELVGPEGAVVAEQTAFLERGMTTATVGFGSQPPLDHDQNYTVRVDTSDYNTDGVTERTPGSPGTDTAVAFGTLDAENATVAADASLTAPPGEATTVTFELVATVGGETGPREGETLPSAVVARETATVGAGETDTGAVDLVADFSETGVSSRADYFVRAVVTDGNDGYEQTATVVGQLGPGDERATEGLRLPAQNATVTADAALGAQPGEATTLTVELVNTDTDTVVATNTSTVPADGTETGPVELPADFATEGVESGADYDVRVAASDGTTDYDAETVAAGGLYPGDRVDVGTTTLAAQNATVTADAALAAPPGEATTVTFELVNTDAETVVATNATTVPADGTQTGTVELTADFAAEGVATADSYAVRATASDGNDGYDAASAPVSPFVPGETVSTTDSLALDAENVTVETAASLSGSPGEATSVTFELTDSEGTTLDTAVADIGPEDNETGTVTLSAVFGEAIASGDQLDVTAEATAGNTNYTVETATATASARPGDTASAEPALDAETATVTVDSALSNAFDERATVTLELVAPDGSVVDTTETAIAAGETGSDAVTLAADFRNSSAAEPSVGYRVTAAANTSAYGDASRSVGTLYPGAEASAGTATVTAEPATVTVTPTLSEPVAENVTLTVELRNATSGATVDATERVVQAGTVSNGTVDLQADFAESPVASGQALTVNASADTDAYANESAAVGRLYANESAAAGPELAGQGAVEGAVTVAGDAPAFENGSLAVNATLVDDSDTAVGTATLRFESRGERATYAFPDRTAANFSGDGNATVVFAVDSGSVDNAEQYGFDDAAVRDVSLNASETQTESATVVGEPELAVTPFAVDNTTDEDSFALNVSVTESVGVPTENLTLSLTVANATGTPVYEATVAPGALSNDTVTVRFGESFNTSELGAFDADQYGVTAVASADNATVATETATFTVTTPPTSGGGGSGEPAETIPEIPGVDVEPDRYVETDITDDNSAREGTTVGLAGTDSVEQVAFSDTVGGLMSVAEFDSVPPSLIERVLAFAEDHPDIRDPVLVSAFDISASSPTAEQSGAEIELSVPSEELEDPEDALVVHRTDDGWEILETSATGTDDGETQLTTTTDSFSLFVVIEDRGTEPESQFETDTPAPEDGGGDEPVETEATDTPEGTPQVEPGGFGGPILLVLVVLFVSVAGLVAARRRFDW